MNIHQKEDTLSIERMFFHYDFKDYLFIIDEAQILGLDVLRAILKLSVSEFDGGQITFVFCGNDELLTPRGARTDAFAQIDRRVHFRQEIKGITDADADILANAYGVDGMEAYQLCRRIGARSHADGVTSTLALARDYAGTLPINIKHIRTALDLLPQYRPADKDGTRRKNKPAAYRVDP